MFLLVQVFLYEHSYLSSKQGQQIESWRESQHSSKPCQLIKTLKAKYLQDWAMCLNWGKCCYIFSVTSIPCSSCTSTNTIQCSWYNAMLRMFCQLPVFSLGNFNSWVRRWRELFSRGCNWLMTFSVLLIYHQRWSDSYPQGALKYTSICSLLVWFDCMVIVEV